MGQSHGFLPLLLLSSTSKMMKLSILMCIASAMVATSAKNLHGSVREQTLIEWETYKDLTSKNYHPEEEGIRLEFFETNLQRINSHNSNGSNHFVQSVNDFAAMVRIKRRQYPNLSCLNIVSNINPIIEQRGEGVIFRTREG